MNEIVNKFISEDEAKSSTRLRTDATEEAVEADLQRIEQQRKDQKFYGSIRFSDIKNNFDSDKIENTMESMGRSGLIEEVNDPQKYKWTTFEIVGKTYGFNRKEFLLTEGKSKKIALDKAESLADLLFVLNELEHREQGIKGTSGDPDNIKGYSEKANEITFLIDDIKGTKRIIENAEAIGDKKSDYKSKIKVATENWQNYLKQNETDAKTEIERAKELSLEVKIQNIKNTNNLEELLDDLGLYIATGEGVTLDHQYAKLRDNAVRLEKGKDFDLEAVKVDAINLLMQKEEADKKNFDERIKNVDLKKEQTTIGMTDEQLKKIPSGSTLFETFLKERPNEAIDIIISKIQNG